MKKYFFSLVAVILTAMLHAQNVGIGTTTPNSSAVLDVTATNRGFLVPRMSTAEIGSIASPAKGLLVYDSAVNQFKVNTGSSALPNWQAINNTSSGWGLTGNRGTDATTDFIGTTDAKPLAFKINNRNSGEIDSASFNTALGFGTLDSVTAAGKYNTAFGYKALFTNADGFYNTANGYQALYANKAGQGNTATGTESLRSNITGNGNTANGDRSLFQNKNGTLNTANGASTLYSNLTGSRNIANGAYALYSNTTGSHNTAIGALALNLNKTGYSNVAIGDQALFGNIDRSNTVAIGDSALYNNGTDAANANDATGNTAVGSKALFANTIGASNTALGYQALYNNTTGGNNTAVGWFSLFSNTSGFVNSAFGIGALSNNTNGFGNCAFGQAALAANQSGHQNTAIGQYADVASGNLFNATAIGAGAIAAASNTIQLGNSNVTNINTAGDLTVHNGKGIIRCTDGAQQKKVTTIVTVNATVDAFGTIHLDFSFPESFSGLPDVYVGNVTGGQGGFAEVVMSVANVTTTGGSLFVSNPRGAGFSPNFSVKVIAIGPQ